MLFIVDEQTARERARQAGTFKFWSVARTGMIGNRQVWQTVGYLVDQKSVEAWALDQIATCSAFRVAGCQYIANQWIWS